MKQLTAINEKNKWINILSVTLIVLALITIVLLLIRYRSVSVFMRDVADCQAETTGNGIDG